MINKLCEQLKVFFTGVECSVMKNIPIEFNLPFLIKKKIVKTRIRPETNRLQINTTDLFDYIIRNKYQPAPNTALFILTDCDLYP